MPFLVRVLFLSIVFFPTFSFAQDATTDSIASPTAIEKVLPDSSNFVTASILLSSPGKEAFFALGHSGIRLKCPSKGLDYCFSYSTFLEPGPMFNLYLLLGKMKAGYEALTFDKYIKTFADEGRGVMEYPLNLTLHEEQELWRLMDEKMMKGPVEKFDFLHNNCTSTLHKCITSIMENENIQYPKVYPLTENTRIALGEIFATTPWIKFFVMFMMSKPPFPMKEYPIEIVLNPKLWSTILPNASIVGTDGSARPALSGQAVQILPQHLTIPIPFWTPEKIFGLILFMVLLLTLLERKMQLRNMSLATDTFLFIVYNLVSFYLLYTSCLNLFGGFWNYFFVVFNPIPLFFFLTYRRNKNYNKVWIIYSIILVGFMVFYSVHMGQIEWAQEFVLATLLARCLASIPNRKELRHGNNN